MSDTPRQKGIPSHFEWISGGESTSVEFAGFRHLSANFTYTPNQFFDVCLPNYSRGVIRLVAYMIRQTLGYCDPDGRTQVQRVSVSYRELEENAGIGHSAIRQAIDEAVTGNFLRCVRIGSPNLNGKRYTTAEYELRWDEGAEYIKDPKRFKGFFEGEGNRTDIPNQFFDVILPTQSLSLIKVVGSVLRFSVGFQTRQGGRRQQAALSYKDLQNYARMGSPRHLSAAIQQAIKTGYIIRTADGFFDTDNGKRSKAATYSIKWETTTTYTANAPKREAGARKAERSEKGSGNSPKREAIYKQKS